MQRFTSVVLGLLVAAGLIGLTLGVRPPAAAPKTPPSGATPSATPAAIESAPAPAAPEPELEPPELSLAESAEPPAANLPPDAPKSVTFGVILFSYAGAQLAPAKARSKDEARALAAAIVPDARKDFAAAVKKGDRGSTANAGQMPRGVLEPSLEQVLFSLEKGQVHPEPIDTPRGYWVMRRND